MNYFIDLDGTLIDSRKRVHDLFIHLTKASISFDDYWNIKREGKDNHLVLQQLGIDAEATLPHFNKDWFHLIESQELLVVDTLLPNTIAALTLLKQEGNLTLVTSRQSIENTMWQLEKLGLVNFFSDLIITEHKKAKPEALAYWLKDRPTVFTERTVMIGDTEEDFNAGLQNKMETIGVLTGFRSEGYLSKFPFTAIYESVYQYSLQTQTTAVKI